MSFFVSFRVCYCVCFIFVPAAFVRIGLVVVMMMMMMIMMMMIMMMITPPPILYEFV